MTHLSIFPGCKFTERNYREIQQKYSYGGFLELRDGIDTETHLGIDISVTDDSDISVITPIGGVMYHVMYDSKDNLEELDGYGYDPEEGFSKLVCNPITLIILDSA